MKKILPISLAFTAIVFSCTGNKAGSQDNVPADSDSVVDTAAVDTMEMLISETPMPKAADELFDDFFFNYAANRKLHEENHMAIALSRRRQDHHYCPEPVEDRAFLHASGLLHIDT